MNLHPLAGRAMPRAEYHALIRDGVLDEDDKVELLRGTITAKPPEGVAHARAIVFLNEHFVLAVSPAVKVRVQMPLTLGDDSEPEPDIALVTAAEAARTDEHPHTALLVVEVAGSSLKQDRELKAGIYARAGIPEYWIVNLEARCVEVHRDPDPLDGRYATLLTTTAPDVVVPTGLPHAALRMDTLFP